MRSNTKYNPGAGSNGRYDTREDDIRRIPMAAMFTALGVLFPQLFHLLGLGSAFLPMFLPVLAAAMLLPLRLACTVAVLTPIVSWLLTGMPPLSPPILPLLLIELLAATCLLSLLRLQLRWHVLPAVAVTMLADRVLLYLIIEGVSAAAGVTHPMLGPAVVLVGLPGVLLAVVVLPSAIMLIEHKHPQLIPIPARGK
ncbi:MAG: hypothetical protein KFH87_12725 [Bacteroidetes bacterium]|nr:hypothetical protein [Bacteroidota bacterium]